MQSAARRRTKTFAHAPCAYSSEGERSWLANETGKRREDASDKASSLSLEEGEVEVAGMGEAAITGEDGTRGEAEPKVAPT